MHYLNKGRLASLAQSANNFFKAAEICLITRGDDLSKCSTKAKLKFNCDDCSAVTHNPGVLLGGVLTRKKLLIHMKSGDCNQCVEYSSTHSSRWHKYKTTIKCYDWKFCTVTSTSTMSWDSVLNKWVATPVTGYGARRPYKRCSSDSDCETGEKCRAYLRGNVSTGVVGDYCN